MKTFLVLTLIFSTNLLAAAPEACEKLKALQAYKGRYELGGCKVEFHICENQQKTILPSYLKESLQENDKSWLGDILIISRAGTKVYVPMYADVGRFPNTKLELYENRDAVVYKYEDKNTDPVSGFKEKYELVFFKKFKRIEVKMKNSVESRKNPIRSLFFPNIKLNCAE